MSPSTPTSPTFPTPPMGFSAAGAGSTFPSPAAAPRPSMPPRAT
ncbi:hypothetical protein E2C01_074202 [Portunus trituberculatus]|uniref:Uncharacterized protein n=2 Tax=Portunus trituberculatus TaxID=210409 RepID=A0A5B7IBS5_PORTR|nr:hypothetical protein [Portunus trituberculatus]